MPTPGVTILQRETWLQRQDNKLFSDPTRVKPNPLRKRCASKADGRPIHSAAALPWTPATASISSDLLRRRGCEGWATVRSGPVRARAQDRGLTPSPLPGHRLEPSGALALQPLLLTPPRPSAPPLRLQSSAPPTPAPPRPLLCAQPRRRAPRPACTQLSS